MARVPFFKATTMNTILRFFGAAIDVGKYLYWFLCGITSGDRITIRNTLDKSGLVALGYYTTGFLFTVWQQVIRGIKSFNKAS